MNRVFKNVLLCGTSLLCLSSSIALAATQRTKKPAVQASHAPAPQAKGGSAAPAAKAEDILVNGGLLNANGTTGREAGGGLISYHRAVNTLMTVSKDFIATQGPTSNPYQLVALQPGVNVGTNDPYGVAGSTITIRGLTVDEIGMLLDGMPTNDPGNMNSYAPQYVASENLQSIDIQPMGGGSEAYPLFGSAGGVMSLHLRDPSHHAGGYADFAYGSYNTDHEFIRVETGDIGNTGLRGYMSYSHIQGNQFVGAGTNTQHHFDLKLRKDWNNRDYSTLTATGTYMMNTNIANPTLASWNASGRQSGAFSTTWSPNNTNYYKLHYAPFYVVFATMRNHVHLADKLTLDLNPYLEHAVGGNGGATTLPSNGAVYLGNTPAQADMSGLVSSGGKSIVASTTTEHVDRVGVSSRFTLNLNANELYVGDYFDFSDETQLYGFSPVSANGTFKDLFNSNRLIYATTASGYSGPVASQDVTTYTYANGLSFGDKIHLMNDRLIIDFGAKLQWFTRNLTNRQLGAPYKTSFNDMQGMPYAGIMYQFTPEHQIYANVSTNYRAPNNTILFQTYSATTGKLATNPNANPKSEYVVSEEIGYRYHSSIGEGNISFFNYNLSNHQLNTTVSLNGAYVLEAINAGKQTSRGVDIAFGLHPWHHIRPFVSGEYLHATMDSNFFNGAYTLPTAGNTAVRSPHWTATFGINYDDGTFFAQGDARYVSSQYSTFMNDEKMPEYAVGNVSFGYRLGSNKIFKKPEFRLNFNNITNNKYLTGIASPQANAHAARSTTGQVVSASGSPTYWIGGGFAVIGSVSAGF